MRQLSTFPLLQHGSQGSLGPCCKMDKQADKASHSGIAAGISQAYTACTHTNCKAQQSCRSITAAAPILCISSPLGTTLQQPFIQITNFCHRGPSQPVQTSRVIHSKVVGIGLNAPRSQHSTHPTWAPATRGQCMPRAGSWAAGWSSAHPPHDPPAVTCGLDLPCCTEWALNCNPTTKHTNGTHQPHQQAVLACLLPSLLPSNHARHRSSSRHLLLDVLPPPPPSA